jgi:hypothetical protein
LEVKITSQNQRVAGFLVYFDIASCSGEGELNLTPTLPYKNKTQGQEKKFNTT